MQPPLQRQECVVGSGPALFCPPAAGSPQCDDAAHTRRYLAGGPAPGDADFQLYVVLVRFDLVYFGLYKLTRRRVEDNPALGGWLRDVHGCAVAKHPVVLGDIAREAYSRRPDLGPKMIAPAGTPDLLAPHDRWRLDAGDSRSGRRLGVEEDGSTQVRGEWVRPQSKFRNRMHAGEAGRYHLYIANNCPWCHRTALARAIKGLQAEISVGVLFYRRDPERGWQFRPDLDGFEADDVNGITFIRELWVFCARPTPVRGPPPI